ncbi:MAG: hypothetical protein WCX46_04695, partial [Candidatus Paceibacterota bacterium]
IAPDYSGAIIASMGDVFVWSPNTNWLKGVWKKDGIATLPEYLKKHPVIIVPGILGSWPWPFSFSKLVLDPFFKTYKGLSETLRTNGYEEEKMLFTFPYNWRNDNVETAKLLKQKIDEVKLISGSNKVDIVAHSMGGLVARSYAQSDYYENDIDQIIFLGTPHLGSPSSYPIWEAGDLTLMGPLKGYFLWSLLMEEASLDGYIGNNYLYRYIHDKVLSVEQLLPIYDYLKFSGGKNYLKYPFLYPKNTFLEGLEKNKKSLLNRKIRVTNIIGDTSNKTTSGFIVQDSDKSPLWEFGEPINYYSFRLSHFFSFINSNLDGIIYSNGDDTVPSVSNENFLSNNIVLKNTSHSDLPNKATSEILKELKIDNPEIKFIDPVHKALIVMAYSPIDFYVEAPDGRRVGVNSRGSNFYSEIEGSIYSGNEENMPEFIIIPDPINGLYKVITVGVNAGKYEVESIYSDDTVNKSYSASYIGETFIGKTEVIDFNLDTRKDLIKSSDNKEEEIEEEVVLEAQKNSSFEKSNFSSNLNISKYLNNKNVLGDYNANNYKAGEANDLFCLRPSTDDFGISKGFLNKITLIKVIMERLIVKIILFLKTIVFIFVKQFSSI